ncbi:MAG: hypothetical protein J7619_25205 [Dyadobacter sp.]|uniref:hypothetical protein n=1 Tax=Dyadobacter sp. TaxID=1914288 RepID=UPI001B07B913|nr:hypothetical protein [Dyadobacter sp.]MBO9616016.1 hypothetical protein [Dyadobacter sp.]
MKEGIEKIYSNRRDFLVIGLTGRTGSGCTTAASILAQSPAMFSFPDVDSFEYSNSNDRRKTNIVLKFVRENRFPFYRIQVKDIITAFILEHDFESFISYVATLISDIQVIENLKSIETEYAKFYSKRRAIKELREDDAGEPHINSVFQFHFVELQDFSNRLKGLLDNGYASVYQSIANNIRSTGSAFADEDSFDVSKTDSIVRKINKFIKLIKRKVEFDKLKDDMTTEKAFIVIDALRNPFEINFLKERHSAFYVLSVNTSEEDRKNRLVSQGYDDSAITKLDNQEYPSKLKGAKLYISQNIQACIELADIHVHNPLCKNDNFNELKRQLLWYYSLILKPGLVTPTPVERVMQIAYTAKFNSGCLSRQVGAVVTDKHYSIKSIGWNNAPQNQVPCLLRNVNDLTNASDIEAYSDYELSNKKFRDFVSVSYDNEEIKNFSSCGNNISFCFKEIQNGLTGDKNQVHTRSLHAEENAFLQLTKYGTAGIEDGILFTTASPCELCSKKAYQLGVTKIYYIDPYPGIATTHILKGGSKNPNLLLYRGVVGGAYFKIYSPLLAYKDEIKQATQLEFLNVPPKNAELDAARLRIEELEGQIKELKNTKSKTPFLKRVFRK